MTGLRIWIFVGITLSISVAAEEDCQKLIPADSDWAFVRAIFHSPLSDSDRGRALATACNEFRPEYWSMYQFHRKPAEEAEGGVLDKAWNAAQTGADAIASHLGMGNSEDETPYLDALREIKNEPDAIKRVKRVYELASSYQKDYDYQRGGIFSHTPGETIRTAKRTGKGGICYDFAGLLAWSLNQVESSGKNHERIRAFFRGESGAGAVGHSWVDVQISKPTGLGRPYSIEKFSLDTTKYPEMFTPLALRTGDVSPQALVERGEVCNKIRACNSSDFRQLLEDQKKPTHVYAAP